MSFKRLGRGASILAMALALGCGADGKDGVPGPQGSKGDQGDAGVVPPLKSDVSGTVTDGTSPLTGVVVTASPGTATATTDGKGAFSFTALDIGAYDLTFHLAGYV